MTGMERFAPPGNARQPLLKLPPGEPAVHDPGGALPEEGEGVLLLGVVTDSSCDSVEKHFFK